MDRNTAPDAVVTQWPPFHAVLHHVKWTGDLSALKQALEAGADITQTADSHRSRETTVLHAAADADGEILDLLLEHGAQVVMEARCGPGEEGRWNGFTALQMAARLGNEEGAQRLLGAGARYDIFSAVALGDEDELSAQLAAAPDALTATDDYGATLLHWAAARDQHAMAERLLARGAVVDARDHFDETPLLVAATRQLAHSQVRSLGRRQGLRVKFTSLVGLLLDRQSPVDVFAAAALGEVEALSSLLERQPRLATATNSHGTTPLHWAARAAQTGSAQVLLDHGADLDAKDAIGCPPLWYSAYWANDLEMTRFLCERGANVGFRNRWDKAIEDYDCGWGHKYLIDHYRR